MSHLKNDDKLKGNESTWYIEFEYVNKKESLVNNEGGAYYTITPISDRKMVSIRTHILGSCANDAWSQSYLCKTLTIYIEQTVHFRHMVLFRLFILVTNRIRYNKKIWP